MKKYFFPIIIASISLLTLYILYLFWHSEPTLPMIKPPSQISDKNSSNDIPQPKNIKPSLPLSFSPKEEIPETEQKMLEEMAREEKTNPPQETTPAQTQAIYDALTPDDHEEMMAAAQEAFERLDQAAVEIDEKLALEMEAVEQNQLEEAALAEEPELPTSNTGDEPTISEPPSSTEDTESLPAEYIEAESPTSGETVTEEPMSDDTETTEEPMSDDAETTEDTGLPLDTEVEISASQEEPIEQP